MTPEQIQMDTINTRHDIRPWGQYWVLEDTASHKVKHIEVNPGGRLSYQFHRYRSEVWTVVSGVATVTLEGEVKEYRKGEVVMIPQGAKHRVQNAGIELLELIEVQLGTYFGEDDIIRIEDDYARH
jgi:mannose-6-phosphate isomerase-like protein (cupin superfamily)